MGYLETIRVIPCRELTYLHPKIYLKMMFLFARWDMDSFPGWYIPVANCFICSKPTSSKRISGIWCGEVGYVFAADGFEPSRHPKNNLRFKVASGGSIRFCFLVTTLASSSNNQSKKTAKVLGCDTVDGSEIWRENHLGWW